MTLESCPCVLFRLCFFCLIFSCLGIVSLYRVFVSCLMFWFFHALMCPLSVSYVLPSVCQYTHPCIPLVISPVGLPLLFLILSSVSVYLVSVFPSLRVRSLYFSASVFVHAPVHVPSPICSLFPHGMCFWIWVLHFAFWFELCFWFELSAIFFVLCLAF